MLPERSPPISTISMATRVGRPCFFLTTLWHTLWLVSDINAFLSIPSSRGSILSLHLSYNLGLDVKRKRHFPFSVAKAAPQGFQSSLRS